MSARDHRERWLQRFTAAVIATLAAATAVLAFEARGQGAPPDGSATITTSAPITGSGTTLSPITCTEAGAAAAGCVTTGAQTLGGKKTFAGGAAITEGTEALPGLAGEDDADTGIRLASAANTITMSTSGTTRWTLNTTGLTLTLPMVLPAGSSSATSVNGGTANTGIYLPSGGVGITIAGTDRLLFFSNEIYSGVDNGTDFGRTDRRFRNIYTYSLNAASLITASAGIDINTTTAKPTCDSSARGRIWVTESGAGVADAIEKCLKDAGDAYAWTAL